MGGGGGGHSNTWGRVCQGWRRFWEMAQLRGDLFINKAYGCRTATKMSLCIYTHHVLLKR